MKVEGEIEIGNMEKAVQFISDYSNLLKCIPNVKETGDKEFVAKTKVGFLTIEVEGKVKAFNKGNDWSETVIEIKGPAVKAIIRSLVKIQDNKLLYDVDYNVELGIPSLKQFIDKQVNQLTNEIICCTRRFVS